MKNSIKSIVRVYLTFSLIIGFVLEVTLVSAQLVVVINSDTTWTTADSPYNITAAVLVDDGATLTIEAGVSVNFNGYDMRVDGTLRAMGNSAEKIYLNNGKIEFTQYSNGWDNQTGSGCIIEHAVLDFVEIVSDVSLKFSNNDHLSQKVSVQESSIIQDNTISVLSLTGGSPIVTGNTINTITDCLGSPEISYNTIEKLYGSSSLSGDSPVISHNNVDQIGYYITHPYGRIEIRHFRATSPVITNNTVKRGIYVNVGSKEIPEIPGDVGHFAVIANNTVTGYSYPFTYDTFYGGFRGTETANLTTSGIILEGAGNISGNRISGCSTGIEGGSLIEGNFLFNNTHGIIVRGGDVVMRGNNITLGDTGIYGDVNTVIMIENNFISNQNSTGISIVGLYGTIQNNTISDTAIAILLNRTLFWININYNNFEDYHENSIYLESAMSDKINATNNWWGTADTQAINLTIRDFKYNFDLGKVNFVPFLTEPNPEAVPTEIPEFSSWMFLPLFLTASLVAFCVRKRLTNA